MILMLEFPIDTSEDDVKDIKSAVWFDSVPASEISQKLMTQAAVEENSEEGSDTALGHEYVPGCTQQEHLVTSQLPSALGGFGTCSPCVQRISYAPFLWTASSWCSRTPHSCKQCR